MSELDFLLDLKDSIHERLYDLSSILNRINDTTTKAALGNNHTQGMQELDKVNERIRQIKTAHNKGSQGSGG
jgi:hypothetical protein